MEPRFANIVLSGPCNLRCPDCVGRLAPGASRADTLGLFPLPGQDAFLAALVRDGVREVSLTGLDTDPLLYRHPGALTSVLRRTVPAVRISLHSNGLPAVANPERLALYDRATISIPSFERATYAAMTGGGRLPDFDGLLASAPIPIKVSVLVTERNAGEVPRILARCRGAGVRRIVLRRRLGGRWPGPMLPGLAPRRFWGGNPVFDLDGLEVTLWEFETTDLDCVSLFPDGSVRGGYLRIGTAARPPGAVA